MNCRTRVLRSFPVSFNLRGALLAGMKARFKRTLSNIMKTYLVRALALLLLVPSALLQAQVQRVTFAGSVHELPAAQKTTLHAMTAAHLGDNVGFNIPLVLRNQVELEARVSAGEVLSGKELRAKYFPLQSDYDAVAAWLKSEGFTVDAIGNTNLAVFAHGTVAQIQNSFQLTMGLVTAKGADQPVALTAPSLPAALARPTLGVSGLSYRRPQSRLVHPAGGTIAQPDAVPSGGYHINQLATAYSGTNLTVNGTQLTGAGQTIAIEAYVNVKTADLTTFWNANAVTRTGTVTTINVNNATLATDAGDIEENALDVEWASGMAPGANVVDYATSYDNNDSPERIYNRVITDASAAGSTVHQLSSSYGPTEAELTSTELAAFNQIFLSMTAAGCTYINATGDVGVYPVEAYGVFPYALGVGGTALQVDTTTFARTTETGWSGSSGGVSANYAHPAWQVGTGTNSALKRQFPDLALAASPSTPAYFVYTTTSQHISTVGGTSWSAPTFAGFMALINQGRALNTPSRGALGFLNPRIYPLILTSNFFDVTSGNNTSGSHTGYSATTGYDMITGVGVPNVSTLLTTSLGPTISSFTPSTGAAGTSVIITGTNFYAGPTAALSVTFNGTAAASVTVNSPTQITAVAPSGVTAGPIVVTSFADSAASSTNFTPGMPDAQASSTPPATVNQDDNGDVFTLTVSNVGTLATSGTTSVTATPGDGLFISDVSGSGWTCSTTAGSGGIWTCTRPDALPVGNSFPVLTALVNVSPNASSGSFVWHVVVSGDTNGVNDYSNQSFAINPVASTPTQQWRYQYFNTTANIGDAADTANPAGDGIINLLKYALGLDPTKPEPSPLSADISTGYLRLTVPKNPNATDLSYAVQVNGDLNDPAGWTTDGTIVEQNTASTLVVRDSTPVSGGVMRFIRLQVSR